MPEKKADQKPPDFYINDIPVYHFNFEPQEYDDSIAAARWAWTALHKLAVVFCDNHCVGYQCSAASKALFTDEFPDSWIGVQEDFHKAFSYLPSFSDIVDDCPACAVVKSLSQFPVLCKKGSEPCYIHIEERDYDFSTEIDSSMHEDALMELDLNQRPAIPPWELSNIKKNLEPGQSVVRYLQLLCHSPSPDENIRVNLPNAVVSAVALKELYLTRYYYPDSIEEDEAKSLHEKLLSFFEMSIQGPGFEHIKKEFQKPDYNDLKESGMFALFQVVLLMKHRDVKINNNDHNKTKANIERIFQKCKDDADDVVTKLADRLTEIMLFDCKIPHPLDDPEFEDPRRFLQMLRQYWGLCRSFIMIQTDTPIGWPTHPFISVLLNLRARVDICFERLKDQKGVDSAKESFNTLMDLLVEGHPDDFSIPEWVNPQVSTVDIFIEETKSVLGSKTYELTHAEAFCIDNAGDSIKNYHEMVKSAWSKIEARTGKTDKKETPARTNIEKESSGDNNNSRNTLHFDGSHEKRRTTITINGKTTMVPNQVFKILLTLAVQLKNDGVGWVHGDKFSPNSSWQSISRVKKEIVHRLLSEKDDIIENDGGGSYRLNVPSENISFDKEEISQHWDKSISAILNSLKA